MSAGAGVIDEAFSENYSLEVTVDTARQEHDLVLTLHVVIPALVEQIQHQRSKMI